MQIVMKLAGYSMGRSDLVRRAMSKKKHKVMEEERKNFIYGIANEDGTVEVPGCLRNGISAANKIFDQMMDLQVMPSISLMQQLCNSRLSNSILNEILSSRNNSRNA